MASSKYLVHFHRIAASILVIIGIMYPSSVTAPSKPTIVLTFDTYTSAYSVAFPIMKHHGIVGTFFVDPRYLDTEHGPTVEQIREMERAGWEIGVYSVLNIPDLIEKDGVLAAREWLISLKSMMTEAGLETRTLASAQRAWNLGAHHAARGIFERVRVSDIFQPADQSSRMAIRRGGTASLSSIDTVASLTADLDNLMGQGGKWIVVTHKVGDDADQLYSVGSEVIGGFIEIIAGMAREGSLRVLTFSGAFE